MLLLIRQEFRLPHEKPSNSSAIKSYIYQPVKIIKKTENQEATSEEESSDIVAPVKVEVPVPKENTQAKPTSSEPKQATKPALPVQPAEKKTQASNKHVGNPGKAVSSIKALDKLKSQIASAILEESAKEFIQQRIADKNKIDRSIASSIKKPLVKKTEVSCDGYISNGIAALSAMMGGTLVCEKPPEIDKYIDARLESMGVKKVNKK